ncbi:uncharacterized protein LOC135374080 [Ornithodoros turicata]|uniref:uncharacterized protein LOC135374080 n=1 Tax=Ornithodoros turicata TaxID=34597 RepID=UPI003138B128
MSRWRRYRELRKEFENIVNEIVNTDTQYLHPSNTTASLDVVPLPQDERGECFTADDEHTTPHFMADETASDLSWEETNDELEVEESQDENDLYRENSGNDLVVQLARLSLKHNLTHSCINDIAALLRSCGHDVPKDARTVLGTQRKAPVEQDGTFVHFGLKAGILESLQLGMPPSEISLQVNIDGLPLYKNSSTCFWPILCMVTNHGAREPFLVSVYCGEGKPPDLNSFLEPFLEEVKDLTAHGIPVKRRHVTVNLTAIICDAVARSYLKRIKGHSGYYGCERCSQKGVHQESRMVFLDFDAALHSDESFRAQTCQSHHKGQSPFVELDIDMISIFPLDYMHLLCLGVMRRLLHIWTGGKYGRGKLTTEQQQTLSERLNSYRKDFPPSFQRKPRGTDELERWKATEFRTFLLYTGPVALKHLLPDKLYNRFLLLHVAARILVSPNLYRTHNEYANKLLRFFVREMGELYGVSQLVYNVHSLIHLAQDSFRHGPLDSFSAFPFESYLGKLKQLLRTTSSPLHQLSRRISEIKHTATPVAQRSVGSDVKFGFAYILNSNTVVRVNEVRAAHVRVSVFSNERDFFVNPLQSSLLDIFRVDNVNNRSERTIQLSAVTKSRQCVLLQYKCGYVVLPLLHQKKVH